MKCAKFLLLFALVFLSVSLKERPVHIFMAGDSTMADKVLFKPVSDSITGESIPEPFPEKGWGQLLPTFFGDNVVVDNYAKNGRSSRTFINEGLWDQLMSRLQKGDYVVIQFGHNDEAKDKVDRYTPPEDYKKNMERFVADVHSKGGIPVLCTSVVRRRFDKDGNFQDSHGEYPDIVRKIAAEKNVLLIDLYEKTKDLVIRLGEEKSKSLFLHLPPGINKNFPNGNIDNTHFNENGAKQVAGLFAEGIKEQKITGLTKQLKESVPPYVSQVWVSDLGNGKYKNPVLNADYSDPDVCRVGDDYYMTSSSFNCIPGLQILHSKDLVNWNIIGYALAKQLPEEIFNKPQHGNGVWAPSIRHRNGEFYIYYGDPDYGIYMTKTKNPAGGWEPPTLVKAGKGLIDACPLWDDDGQMYLVHAYAGSRAGIKSILAVTHLSPDGKKAVGTSKTIYDGHEIDGTIEGPKFYKRNRYYYIFAPAGGVATGWQVVLRSENIGGPYERKVVLTQGQTDINGPHQGAWVDTKTGEDWFLHFQDTYAYGRVVHLQPMIWKNDWPVIGEDKDGDGCGEPVLTYKKPNVGEAYPKATPDETDEFSEKTLGYQWQWHANPQDWWYYADTENDQLSLYSVPVPEGYKNLWDIPSLLLQKFPARNFTATTKITFKPNDKITGERTGLLVMGLDYALLSIEYKDNNYILSQSDCLGADKGNLEKMNGSVTLTENSIYLRVIVNTDATCSFSYSQDGKVFKPLGNKLTVKEGKWIGAKVGLFCTRPVKNNDGGKVDIDWFRIEK